MPNMAAKLVQLLQKSKKKKEKRWEKPTKEPNKATFLSESEAFFKEHKPINLAESKTKSEQIALDFMFLGEKHMFQAGKHTFQDEKHTFHVRKRKI